MLIWENSVAPPLPLTQQDGDCHEVERTLAVLDKVIVFSILSSTKDVINL